MCHPNAIASYDIVTSRSSITSDTTKRNIKDKTNKETLVTGKITGEEDDVRANNRQPPQAQRQPTTEASGRQAQSTTLTTTSTTTTTELYIETSTERRMDSETEPTPLSEVGDPILPTQEIIKPRPRLLHLNVDELQNFAIALHNETNAKGQKKHLTDLSDVNLDVDDDDEPRMIPVEHKHKDMPEKFYANLQAPFHPLMTVERGSEEIDTCKENEIIYKVRLQFQG